VSLVARHLEENGIPTVTIGSARDIVERCRVPRLLWPRGDDWKETVLTQEQPFLDEQQTASWLAAKADYQRLKAEGKV
jgi:hypothetical protein